MKWEWTGDFSVHTWLNFECHHTLVGSLCLLCMYNMLLTEGHSLEKGIKQLGCWKTEGGRSSPARLENWILRTCFEICKSESFAHENSEWPLCFWVVIPLFQFIPRHIKTVCKCPDWSEMFFDPKLWNSLLLNSFSRFFKNFLYHYPLLISSYCYESVSPL